MPLDLSRSPSIASPLLLGRYEVFDAIASGGMATIHFGRMRGDAGFARTVAVKRMHKQLAENDELVRMFMDEARLVARIRHPNVVPILDVVREGEEMFIVMEYVHGEPLDRLVHRPKPAPMPPAIAIALFADVLHGLHAAHEATSATGDPLNIVHRDVTPHNMLVGVDGSARIADFGIAKAESREQMMTQAGTLKGKLSYIAPEQLDGEALPATDVYAASVSLYEALTGRILFSGNNEGEILHKIALGATHPPSSLVPSISPELDEIVMRGIEMRPHKRFKTAREMALALEKANGNQRPPASEIAAWVQARASDMIRKRANALALIEKRPFSSPSQPPSEEVVALHEPLEAPPQQPGDDFQARTKTMNNIGQMTVAGLPSRRRQASSSSVFIAIGLGLLTGIAGLGVIGWARAHRGTSSTTTVPTAPTQSTEQPPPPPDTEEADNDPASPATPLSTLDAPSKALRPKKNGGGGATPSATTSVAPPPNCNPPYTRDETGRKLYKRECL